MFHSKRSYWRKLDNAAKLFPATSNKKDTRVFRFYCIMKEDVKEEILQQAVEKALEKYPLFLSVMRKGLFWHYLEKRNLKSLAAICMCVTRKACYSKSRTIKGGLILKYFMC